MGFVGAALEGDGTLEFLELGHQPRCVAAGGERLAWRTGPNGTLWSEANDLIGDGERVWW